MTRSGLCAVSIANSPTVVAGPHGLSQSGYDSNFTIAIIAIYIETIAQH